jgi:DNA polymerase IV
MTVVHVNVIGFYTAVAAALDASLRGRPLAVATPGQSRRMLLDVSRQAMVAGLHRGMLTEHAQRRCRDLILIDPMPDRAMDALTREAINYSPVVESAGPGHLFIDLAGTERLWGRPLDAAERMRKGILDNYRLDPSLGVAVNKLVSKVATRVVRPTGLCEVMTGSEREFLSPLPLGHLPGVADELIQELRELNLHVIADVVSLGPAALLAAFGSQGRSLYNAAQGQDDTPVRFAHKPAPSVSEHVAFPGQTNDDAVFLAALWKACSRCARRLRKMALGTRRLALTITYADGQRVRRSGRFGESTLSDFVIFDQAERLFRSAYQRRVRLKSLAIRLEGLTWPCGQLYLFDLKRERKDLLRAIDAIRDRFGEDAIDLAAYQTDAA